MTATYIPSHNQGDVTRSLSLPVFGPCGEGYFFCFEPYESTDDTGVSTRGVHVTLYKITGDAIARAGTNSIDAFRYFGSGSGFQAPQITAASYFGNSAAIHTQTTMPNGKIQREVAIVTRAGAGFDFTNCVTCRLSEDIQGPSATATDPQVNHPDTYLFGYDSLVLLSQTDGIVFTMGSSYSGNASGSVANLFGRYFKVSHALSYPVLDVPELYQPLNEVGLVINVNPAVPGSGTNTQRYQSPAGPAVRLDATSAFQVVHDWAYGAGDPAKFWRVAVENNMPVRKSEHVLPWQLNEYAEAALLSDGHTVGVRGLIQPPTSSPQYLFRMADRVMFSVAYDPTSYELTMSPSTVVAHQDMQIAPQDWSGTSAPQIGATNRQMIVGGTDQLLEANGTPIPSPPSGRATQFQPITFPAGGAPVVGAPIVGSIPDGAFTGWGTWLDRVDDTHMAYEYIVPNPNVGLDGFQYARMFDVITIDPEAPVGIGVNVDPVGNPLSPYSETALTTKITGVLGPRTALFD